MKPWIILGLFVLAGCATAVPKIAITETGKPEVIIKTDDFSAVKNALISDMVKHDYMMDSESETLMVFSRAAKGGENLVASLSIGNGYSSNKRVTKIMLLKQPGSVHVFVSAELTAQLPGGQTNSTDLSTNPNVFNDYQKDLIDLKAAIEAKAEKK